MMSAVPRRRNPRIHSRPARYVQPADPQTRQLLDGLMRRPVLSQRDAVVRPDVDDMRLAQRREPDARSACSPRTRRTSRRTGSSAAVERHAGHRGGHGVLAKAEVNVSSRVAPDTARSTLRWQVSTGLGRQRALEVAASAHPGASRRIEIGRSADQVRHGARQRLEDGSSRVACRRLAVGRRETGRCASQPQRELARQRTEERACQVRMRDRVRVDAVPPRCLADRRHGRWPSELLNDVIGYIEVAIVRPSQRALGQPHFLGTERLAVRVPRVLRGSSGCAEGATSRGCRPSWPHPSACRDARSRRAPFLRDLGASNTRR